MAVARPAKRPVVTASEHNAVLEAAQRRVDHLEGRLADVIEPILHRAGTQAARRFRETATQHLVSAAANGDVPESATMVALKPRPGEAVALADPDGDPPEILHLTLVYLGQTDQPLQEIADALKPVAATYAPLEGVVGGSGVFQGPGVGILLPDVRGLAETRTAVAEALLDAGIDYARDHGFLPHISVNGDADLHDAADEPIHFDALHVVRGNDEEIVLPLVGVRALTAAGPVWTPPFPDELIDVDALVKQILDRTEPVRRAMIEQTMTPALRQAGLSWDVNNPLTAALLQRTADQVTNIALTTRANLMKIIGSAYQNGLTVPQTAGLIREGMAAASKVRSTMIARTELARAVNGGSLAATQLVSNVTGQKYDKVWHTAPGARYPRHELYEGLDGQTVPQDATFDVGGDQLQYPGDPNGDPGETINCRCTLTYREVEEARAAEGEIEPEPGELEATDSEVLTVGLDPLPNTQDVTKLSRVLSRRAKLIEIPVSAILRQVFRDAGAEFAGFKFRLKGVASTERKIKGDSIAKHLSHREDAYQISDTLRYTATFEPGEYTAGARAILRELEDRGFKIDRVRNTWSREGIYAGINTRIATPNGYKFELQFHTPESFDLKNTTNHVLYEKYRTLDGSSPEAHALEDQMNANVRDLDFPPGVEEWKWPDTTGEVTTPPAPQPTPLEAAPERSVDIGITPFRAGEDNEVGFYESPKYQQFVRDVNESAQAYGVKIDGLDKVTGVWEGETEPAVSLRVTAPQLPRTVPPPIDFADASDTERAWIEKAVTDAYRRMDQAGVTQDWKTGFGEVGGQPRHVVVQHYGSNEAALQFTGDSIEINVDSSLFPPSTFRDDAAALARGEEPRFINEDLGDTIIHEYGHAAYQALDQAQRETWKKFWNDWPTKGSVTGYPSFYAQETAQEAWAETFVALVRGYPQGAAFQDVMRPLLQDTKVLGTEDRTQAYRIQHQAPDRESGSPMFDLTQNGTYPPDVYDKDDQMRLYGQPNVVPAVPGGYDLGALDQKVFDIVNRVHGDPTKMVTIYRAVPGDVHTINPGDWVTPSKEYADLNTEAVGLDQESPHVVSMQVPASQLYTDGNSIAEWGWDPPARFAYDSDARFRAFASNLGQSYNQDGVLLFSPNPEGDSLMATFHSTLPENRVTAAMAKVGISGGRFTVNGRLQVIGERTPEFVEQIAALARELGDKADMARGSFSMLERDAGDYQRALDEFAHPKGVTPFDIPDPEPPPPVETPHGAPLTGGVDHWPEMDKIINAPAQKEWLDNLTTDEKKVLDAYTQDGYKDINNFLAGHKLDDSNLEWYRNVPAVEEAAARLQLLVRDAPPLPANTTLYRGINAERLNPSLRDAFDKIEQDVIDEMGLGTPALRADRILETYSRQVKTLADWTQEKYPVGSYVHLTELGEIESLSTDPDIASEIIPSSRPGIVFRVEDAQTGAPIWPYSAHVGEHEVLASPETTYRVKAIETRKMDSVFVEGTPGIEDTAADRVVVTVEEVPAEAARAVPEPGEVLYEQGMTDTVKRLYAEQDLDTASLVRAAQKAVEEMPERLVHGNTGETAFWITKGKVYSWGDYNKMTAAEKETAVPVHSHSGVNYFYSDIPESHEPWSSPDIQQWFAGLKKGTQGGRQILLYADGRADIIGIGPETDVAVLKMGPKTLRKSLEEAGYRPSAGPEATREVFRKWFADHGITYEEVQFDDPARLASIAAKDKTLLPEGQTLTRDTVLADRSPNFGVAQYVPKGDEPFVEGPVFPGQDSATIEHAARTREQAIAFYARDNGMTPDEYQAAADQIIKSYIAAHPQIRIRVTDRSLEGIARDGRFKSEFEIPGVTDEMTAARAEAEKNLFGYSPDMDPALRPIYGYLSGTADETGVVQEYGELIVNLDPSVNARATFTIGDSFQPALRGDLAPSLLANPGIGSWDGSFDIVRAYRLGDLEALARYVEVEIHGGLPVSDIGSIARDLALIVSREDAIRIAEAAEAVTELAANYKGTQLASPETEEAGIPTEKPAAFDIYTALLDLGKTARDREGALGDLLARIGRPGKIADSFVDFNFLSDIGRAHI